MPSLRVLSVVLLAGIGAAAAGLAGGAQEPRPAPDQRAALVSPVSPGRSPATAATRGESPEYDAQAENALPGTPGWAIPAARGTAPGLSAYAGAVSVRPGTPVALHVTASGPDSIDVRAFRIGWYGGAGARLLATMTLPAAPVQPASSARDPASWPVLGSIPTTSWPPGQYLLRLDHDAASRFVPLLVRSPRLAGALVLVTSPLTWQAENPPALAGARDRQFGRPYAQGYGAGPLLSTDAPVIQLAERDGHRLAYTTDLDLARTPSELDGATALVFGSASQYWTAGLRTAVIGAITAGTNAAFFGAGTGTRRVELSSDGRSMKVLASVPRATTALTGLAPACPVNGASDGAAGGASDGTAGGAGSGAALTLGGAASWVVRDPGWWGYARVQVRAGQALAGLVSGAPDGVADPVPGAAVVARSPIGCTGGTGAAGDHTATYWTTRGGAGVFATGTSRWACAAGNTCPSGSGAPVPRSTRRIAVQVTRVVLVAFAQPRAGVRRPA